MRRLLPAGVALILLLSAMPVRAIPPGGCTPVPKCAVPTPTVIPTVLPTPTSAPPTPTPPPSGDYLIISRAELLSLSTTIASYTAMKAIADQTWATPNLTDGTSVVAGQAVAAGIVYARTGTTSYKAKVENVLAQLPSQNVSTADVLDVVRQLGGFVIAADLVGYRPQSFLDFVADMRTHTFCCHTRWTRIDDTSDDTANNWGAWAMETRVATDLYLGDTVDLVAAVTTFKGYLGDHAMHVFNATLDYDSTWNCDTLIGGINRDCGDRSGAVIEDISRSAGSYPTVDATGLMYSWEGLGGAVLTARLLEHNGYPDVWTWSSEALRRAGVFMNTHGGYPPEFSTNQIPPWEINDAYGINLGPVNPAGRSRTFCCADWLTGH